MLQSDRFTRRFVFCGAGLALSSAVLFGASTPLAKVLLQNIDPWLLAALLYLGSGVGLLAVRSALGARRLAESKEAPLAGADWRWLGGAILFGGVLAPVLLMVGLTHTPAASASLLLNLEGVLTAVLAWFVFRENFDRRIALGMLAITTGAGALSWQDDFSVSGIVGPLAIGGACLGWALDNNLTRKVSLGDPVQIAIVKGLIARAINLLLALSEGAHVPNYTTGLVGSVGYGLSLVLFVLALRHIGTARTGAYFSTAPFVGAAIAVLFLGEPLTGNLAIAGTLMAFGLWLHLTERHDHEHEHEETEHEHRHVHDEHHRHAHDPDEDSDSPHTHRHTHIRLRHWHAHFPDAHHGHGH